MMSGVNFTRSAKAPMISAGVMQAKVIWKQMNQAVFQLGYGDPQEVTDILIERVEIIRDETETQNGHRGIIVLSASKGCRFSDVRFEDIKIYGARSTCWPSTTSTRTRPGRRRWKTSPCAMST